MLISFIALFIAYCYVIARPWRFVPTLRRLHTQLGLISANCRGVFVGNYPAQDAQYFIQALLRELQSHYDFDLYVYETERENHNERFLYANIQLFLEEDDVSTREIEQLIRRLKVQFTRHAMVRIRQYIKRDNQHDRRVGNKSIAKDFRKNDRRSKYGNLLIYKTLNNNNSVETLRHATNPAS
ncbi:MAG: hypothetical protein U5O69_02475 [Candidatus Competibacteraceae bacterium]|nr:hypothetical protein [Candidatus Competibacteraceae bacterium]